MNPLCQYVDDDLEKKIAELRQKIQIWASGHNLWQDCGFHDWIEFYDDEPRECPCVLVFWFEAALHGILNGYIAIELLNEFDEIIRETDFYYEHEDQKLFFYVRADDTLEASYRDYYEWRWILGLIQLEYNNLYEEVYQRFSKNSSELHRLTARQYEQLLDSIFKNNGFRTELGPGQGDGGVDIRLITNDVVGEVITLVQAKKYSLEYPIKLEAVQALTAAVDDEKAHRGLFVTTSRYLPSVRRFAARQQRKLELATSEDVVRWSQYAATRIIRDKTTLVSTDHLLYLLNATNHSGLIGSIFHAQTGYGIVANTFLLVLKESKEAALVIKLPNTVVQHDGYGSRGCELPTLDDSIVGLLSKDRVFRVKKTTNPEGIVGLWGAMHYYTSWDGTAQFFDHND